MPSIDLAHGAQQRKPVSAPRMAAPAHSARRLCIARCSPAAATSRQCLSLLAARCSLHERSAADRIG
jgi:hypothetical protein